MIADNTANLLHPSLVMNINIKADIKPLKKKLTSLEKRQLPFASSVSINKTGVKILSALGANAAKKFEGGATKQALRAFKTPTGLKGNRPNINFSTKKDLSAKVFMPDWAEKFLTYQVLGGQKTSKKKEGFGVPTSNKRLNKFGNIAGKKSGLVKGKKQFIATIKGITGVWERYGRGGRNVKLIIAFEKTVRYDNPKFPFFKIGEMVYKSQFPKILKKELRNAIATQK
tara:strand:- start:4 stop:687 length:684 start_codon:yes stop_codon:yes gene_type:complete